MAVEKVDDVRVDLSSQNPLHHPYGGSVGDPEAVDELGFDALVGQGGGDLRAAAMDDHGSQPHHRQEGDVAGETLMKSALLHGRPAVLDDHGASPEGLDVGQGLHQDPGLPHRIGDPALGQIGSAVTGGHDRSPLNLT